MLLHPDLRDQMLNDQKATRQLVYTEIFKYWSFKKILDLKALITNSYNHCKNQQNY